MKTILPFMAWLAACGASVGHAEQKAPVLVELFTSQGCYSCPPADAVLGALAQREDVIALAYHVTYWDRLGWPDTFGQAKFDDRQRRYAQIFDARSIYTPQAVIAGEIDAVGSRSDRVASAIDFVRREGRAQRIDIGANRTILLPALPLPQPVDIWVAAFDATETVTIDHGENGGKTLDYHRIVKDWRSLGAWNGEARALEVPSEDWREAGHSGFAVVAQDAVDGRIVALGQMLF